MCDTLITFQSIKRFIGRFRLRTVLTVSLVLILICAMGAIWYLAYLNSQYTATDLASQLQDEVSSRIEQHLNTYLETPKLVNQLCLDSIWLGDIDIHNNSELEQHFRKLSYRFPTVESICYANEEEGNYTIISSVGATGIVNGTDRFLGFSRASTNFTFEEYLTDSNGTIIRRTIDPIPYDPRSRLWYKTAVNSNHPTWTPVYMWVEGVVSQDFVLPVISPQNKLLGVLDTSLTLTGIGDFLQNLQISQHGQAFIIEKSGMLVASSSIKKPYSTRDDTLVRLSALNSTNPVIQSTSRYLIDNINLSTNITSRSQYHLNIGGVPEWVQITPYRDNYGLDWLIVVVIPESDFMEKIDANNQITILLILSVIFCTILLCIVLARWITKPILSLNRSAKSLAKGDWIDWLDLDRHDEIGELSQSFKQMADQLYTTFISLKTSEERYIRLFQSSADAILLFDKFILIQMNRAGEEMFDITKEEAIGKDIRFLFDNLGSGIGKMISSISTSEKGYLDQTISRVFNDRTQFMNIRLTIVPVENKFLTLVHIRDITDQRRAIITFAEQEALKESYTQIQTILQFLPDPTFVINSDGEIIIWNRAIEELTGRTSEEMIGSKDYSYSDGVHNSNQPVLIDIALHPDILSENRYESIEYEGELLKTSFKIDTSGQIKFLSCLAARLYNKNGDIIGAIESIRDITTHKLDEEALLIANKKLNLLSSITRHDIINKIMITKAHVYLLEETILDEEQIESISAIKRSMNEIEHFISFTKTYQELGIKVPVWQDVGITCSKAAGEVSNGEVEIHNNVYGVSILVDPLFEKVCYNLIENAVRHGEHLTDITISAYEIPGGLRISFEDNGSGIPDDIKELIFERGYGKNTGYGLFLTREILSISEIIIKERGIFGNGSRFDIDIPNGKFRMSS